MMDTKKAAFCTAKLPNMLPCLGHDPNQPNQSLRSSIRAHSTHKESSVATTFLEKENSCNNFKICQKVAILCALACSTMSSTTSPASCVSGEKPPHVVEDFLGVLQLMSDGTVKRAPAPLVLAEAAPLPSDAPVQWKDVVYDEGNNLSLRMYVPSGASSNMLTVIVYFQSGAFLSGGFAVPDTHDACLRLAIDVPAVVLSADYSLAPEHRLPAALDDAESFFSWLRSQAAAAPTATDQWLVESADFGRVFISGDSSGANMAHQLAVRIGSGKLAADPVPVAGYLLLFPYFGGEQRTATEATCPVDGVFLTLALYDQVWRLALPVGATRDHPAANPFGPDSPAIDSLELPPVLVTLGDRDMLLDRIRDYVARLKAAGTRVELVELAGRGHMVTREAMQDVVRAVRRFVHGGLPELRI